MKRNTEFELFTKPATLIKLEKTMSKTFQPDWSEKPPKNQSPKYQRKFLRQISHIIYQKKSKNLPPKVSMTRMTIRTYPSPKGEDTAVLTPIW